MSWADLSNKPAKGKTKKSKRQIGEWDAIAKERGEAIFASWTEYRSDYRRSWGDDTSLTPEQERMSARLRHSAKMVQTFVDALSGAESNYTVSIDAEATTASTDIKNRRMSLPARMILDPALTEEEAALLMVSYIGHEIGHARFDVGLDKAMRSDDTIKAPLVGTYNQLSTILRESRVEAGFSRLFPGYGGLFAPLLRWISRGTKDGSKPPADALSFAVAATRYPFRFNWNNKTHREEAAWWVKWVERNQWVEDYPGHKAAIDEAVAHIQSKLPPQQADNQPGQPGQGGESGQGAAGDSPYEKMSATRVHEANDAKYDLDRAAAKERSELRNAYFSGAATTEEYQNAMAQLRKQIAKQKSALTREANKSKEQAKSIPVSIEDAPPSRGRGRSTSTQSYEEVQNRSTAARDANVQLGLTADGSDVLPMREESRPTGTWRLRDPADMSGEATSIFRSLFMRMRGGYEARTGNHRRGRLDDRKIFRLADRGEDRIFTRRGAPKTQPLRVYVMVDVSGSMGGAPMSQVKGIARALAEASVGVRNLHLEIFGWDATVYNAYRPGEDPAAAVDSLAARGSTRDADALRFARLKMMSEKRDYEHGLIIMLSDGAGQRKSELKREVGMCREAGLSIYGMAIGAVDLTSAYGKDHWVAFRGSVAASAQPLSEIIALSWASKSQRKTD